MDGGPSSPGGTKDSSPSRYSFQHPVNHVAEALRQEKEGHKEVPQSTTHSTELPQSPTTSHASQSPRTSNIRFSHDGQHATKVTSDGPSGSFRSTSTRSSVELSVVDQKWGILFDNDGHPTGRLRQILTGLAEYIAARFLPQNSIVITPEKLAAFYSYHRLEQDTYPFPVLFKSHAKDFDERLADLFQDLHCPYHLVQTNPRCRPSIPCLTPEGFAQWLILNIQAYPDEEAKRLQTIVSAIPIDVESPLDGKPERLPVQISRQLLPEKSIRRSRLLFDEAMKDFMEDLELPFSRNTSPYQMRYAKQSGEVSPQSRYIPTASDGSPKDTPRHSSSIGSEVPIALHSRGSTHQTVRPHRMSSGDSSRPRSRDPYNIPPPPVGRNSVSRTNRSPQQRPFSQSVPANISDSGMHGGTSSTNSSIIFTPSSASNMSPTSEVATLRGNDGEYRVHAPLSRDRPSVDESTPRTGSTVDFRDHIGRNRSEKDAGKRRSLVSHDSRGPTWDEVIRQQGRL